VANSIFHLFQLQKIDLRIDVLDKRQKEILAIRNDNSARKLLENKLEEINKSLTTHKKMYSDLDDKVSTKRLKIEQSESSLYGGTIKNPKELQDLQLEIQSLKQTITNLEDAQLQKLDELDLVEKDKNDLLAEIENLDAKLSKVYSAFSVEENEMNSEFVKLENERKAVVSQISTDLIKTYDDLKKSKKGIALASVEDGCCTACGSTLTPAECQSAKSPSRITNCPSCGRILYAG